jgi:transposase
METQRRGSDGRRLFSAEFKREQVARVLRKEITFAELSRELGIDQSVVRRWQHLVDRGSRTTVAADEDVVPASELRAVQLRIRDLERALGKKTMEVEILKEAVELARPKKRLLLRSHLPDKDGGE